MKIVFDTFAWIEYFEGTEKGREVDKYLQNNDILTPIIALLEISYRADKRNVDIKKQMDFIKMNSRIIGFNDEFIFKFGKIYNKSKEKNKNFGLADAIVLTSAMINEAKILTGDHHFKDFENVILMD